MIFVCLCCEKKNDEVVWSIFLFGSCWDWCEQHHDLFIDFNINFPECKYWLFMLQDCTMAGTSCGSNSWSIIIINRSRCSTYQYGNLHLFESSCSCCKMWNQEWAIWMALPSTCLEAWRYCLDVLVFFTNLVSFLVDYGNIWNRWIPSSFTSYKHLLVLELSSVLDIVP